MRLKGLMPAQLRQELEDTITSLKSQVSTHTHTHIHAHIHAHSYVITLCTRTAFIHIHNQISISGDSNVHLHTHTHTHTHTRTHTLKRHWANLSGCLRVFITEAVPGIVLCLRVCVCAYCVYGCV